MKLIPTVLEGILLVESDLFRDNRGCFTEIYKKSLFDKFREVCFVQDNLSYSVKGVLRGLHYQKRHKQAKYIKVVEGEIFDVAVDLRRDSVSFGKWESYILSDENNRRLFLPEGFAHGFCVLSERAVVMYKCTDYYYPEDEGGIIWSDPGIGINWPVKDPILSEKDRMLPSFAEVFNKTPGRSEL